MTLVDNMTTENFRGKDEQSLLTLLDECTSFEKRRQIRAAIRQLKTEVGGSQNVCLTPSDLCDDVNKDVPNLLQEPNSTDRLHVFFESRNSSSLPCKPGGKTSNDLACAHLKTHATERDICSHVVESSNFKTVSRPNKKDGIMLHKPSPHGTTSIIKDWKMMRMHMSSQNTDGSNTFSTTPTNSSVGDGSPAFDQMYTHNCYSEEYLQQLLIKSTDIGERHKLRTRIKQLREVRESKLDKKLDLRCEPSDTRKHGQSSRNNDTSDGHSLDYDRIESIEELKLLLNCTDSFEEKRNIRNAMRHLRRRLEIEKVKLSAVSQLKRRQSEDVNLTKTTSHQLDARRRFSEDHNLINTRHIPERKTDTVTKHIPERKTDTVTKHYSERKTNSVTQHIPVRKTDTVTKHIPERKTDTVTKHIPERKTDTVTKHIPERKTDTVTKHYSERKTNSVTKHIPERKTDTVTKHIPERKTDTVTKHIPERKTDTVTKHIPERKTDTATKHYSERKTNSVTKHIPERKTDTVTKHIPERKKDTVTKHYSERKTNSVTKPIPKQQYIERKVLNVKESIHPPIEVQFSVKAITNSDGASFFVTNRTDGENTSVAGISKQKSVIAKPLHIKGIDASKKEKVYSQVDKPPADHPEECASTEDEDFLGKIKERISVHEKILEISEKKQKAETDSYTSGRGSSSLLAKSHGTKLATKPPPARLSWKQETSILTNKLKYQQKGDNLKSSRDVKVTPTYKCALAINISNGKKESERYKYVNSEQNKVLLPDKNKFEKPTSRPEFTLKDSVSPVTCVRQTDRRVAGPRVTSCPLTPPALSTSTSSRLGPGCQTPDNSSIWPPGVSGPHDNSLPHTSQYVLTVDLSSKSRGVSRSHSDVIPHSRRKIQQKQCVPTVSRENRTAMERAFLDLIDDMEHRKNTVLTAVSDVDSTISQTDVTDNMEQLPVNPVLEAHDNDRSGVNTVLEAHDNDRSGVQMKSVKCDVMDSVVDVNANTVVTGGGGCAIESKLRDSVLHDLTAIRFMDEEEEEQCQSWPQSSKMEAQQSTQADSKMGAQQSTQSDSKMEAQQSTQSDSKMEAQQSTQSDSKMEVQQSTQSDSKMEAQQSTQSDSKMEAQQSTQSDSRMEVQQSTQSDSKMEAQQSTQSDSKMEAQQSTQSVGTADVRDEMTGRRDKDDVTCDTTCEVDRGVVRGGRCVGAQESAVIVKEEEDGAVTVQQVSQTGNQDRVVTVRSKMYRTPSNAQAEERDTIVETKFTSPGGTELNERDVIRTKKKITSRGSNYYKRSVQVTRRARDREGIEVLQQDVCVESDNRSVSRGQAWGDRVVTRLTLDQPSQQHAGTAHTIGTIGKEGVKESQDSLIVKQVNVCKASSGYASVCGAEADERVDVVDIQCARPLGCPTITSELQDVSAILGESVVLQCAASGEPAPNVTWYAGYDEIHADNSSYTITYDQHTINTSLTIHSVKGGSQYRCVFHNQHGEAEAKTSVSIQTCAACAPVLVSGLVDMTVTEGHSATLSCTVTHADTLTWYHDAIIQRNSEDFKQSYDGETATLEIGEVFLDDVGEYACVAHNRLGEERTACHLTVTACDGETCVVPMFLTHLQPTSLPGGATLTLHCDVIGSPQPNITWTKDGRPLRDNCSCNAMYDGRTATLEVESMEVEDSGKYGCVASNEAGHVSSHATVTVTDTAQSENGSSKSTSNTVCSTVNQSRPISGLNQFTLQNKSLDFGNSAVVSQNVEMPSIAKPIVSPVVAQTIVSRALVRSASHGATNRPIVHSAPTTSGHGALMKSASTHDASVSRTSTPSASSEHVVTCSSDVTPSSECPNLSRSSSQRLSPSCSNVPPPLKVVGKTLSLPSTPSVPSTNSPVQSPFPVKGAARHSPLNTIGKFLALAVAKDKEQSTITQQTTTQDTPDIPKAAESFIKTTPVAKTNEWVKPMRDGESTAPVVAKGGRYVSKVQQLQQQLLGETRPPPHSSKPAIRRWHSLPPQDLRPPVKRDGECSSVGGTNQASMPSYDDVHDEEELMKVMSKTDDFDERKKIRARLKEIREKDRLEREARRAQREKEADDVVRLKAVRAEEDKQRRLQNFANMAAKPETKTTTETKTGADGSKVTTTTTTSTVKTEDGGTRTQTVKKTETAVTKTSGMGGVQYAKPGAEARAGQWCERLHSVSPAGSSGSIWVRQEAWTSTDGGQVHKSEKTETWGARGGRGGARGAMAAFKQMDATNSPAQPNALVAVSLAKRAATTMKRNAISIKQEVLAFCKLNTREYQTVEITNFSSCWNNGIAFCALIHHFFPDAFDFNALNPKNRRYNFDLAFDTAEKMADIAPLLDTDDMVRMKNPDWKCVFTYVQSIYRHLREHDANKAKAEEQ